MTPIRAAVAFGLDTSALGSTAPLLEARLGFEAKRLGLYAFGDVLRPQSITLEGGVAEIGLWEAGVSGCFRWLEAALSSGLCAGAELGRMTARGDGFTRARDDSALWLGFRTEAELGWRFSPQVSLRAVVGGIAPARTLYVAVSPERIYATPALTGRGLLGLEAAF